MQRPLLAAFLLSFIVLMLATATLQGKPVFDTTNPYYGPNYQSAHFPGGDSALKQYIKINTRYPADYRDSSIQGRTIVRFMVGEKGDISDIAIVRGIGGQTDAEAKCVVGDMPAWIPATYKKKPIK